VTILKFKSGAVGKCMRWWIVFNPTIPHTLVGSEGSLLDNKFHSMKLDGLNKNKWSELSMQTLDSGDVSDHPYQTHLGLFRRAGSGKEMPLTSLRDALLQSTRSFSRRTNRRKPESR